MKVKNMTGNSGKAIANQFIITTTEHDCNVEYLQSYKSIIIRQCFGNYNTGIKPSITLDKRFWDYSKTTGKYRNIFLGETKAETQKKINSGEYILADLN